MIYSISASQAGPSGTAPLQNAPIPGTNNGIIFLPMKTDFWRVGVSCLVNFSGQGQGVAGSPASATAYVQVCNDPALNGATPSSARWSNHDTLQNLTADKNSSIIYPCYAVRLYLLAYISGTVTLMVGGLDYQL